MNPIMSDVQPELLREFFHSRLDHALDLLRQMVEINSFTSNPAGINRLGHLTASAFAPLGFTGRQVPSANPKFGSHLVMNRPGTGSQKIALISHLDTVFPPEDEINNDFHWRPDGDRIYGPGTVDIKGGTVLIYMVMEALHRFAPALFDSVHWVILLNSSEETISVDFGSLVKSELGAEGTACLVFEGGKRDGNRFDLVTARKGMAMYHVTVEGKASHAGVAHESGANAIVEMARVIDKIASFTDYSRFITFNVGTVHGGTVTNRVPHFAEARVEMRTYDPAVFADGVQKMLALNQHSSVTSADGYPCRVKVELFHRTTPWPQNPGTIQLFQIWQETGNALGLDVRPEERGGLSDGNLLWDTYLTLDALGPAGGNAHCSERSADGSKDQEYVVASSFVPKALLNTMALLKLISG